MVLCLVFGITASTCLVMIRFARHLLLLTIQKKEYAAIHMATAHEYTSFCQAVKFRHTLLSDLYATMDGLKL